MTALINASTSSGLITTADTSGELALQSNGTTKFTVSSTGAYGQVAAGTAVASTSGTSIDFTSLPSWVKRITVMISGFGTGSGGTSVKLVQLGTSSGFQTTSYTSVAVFMGATNSVGGAQGTTGFVFGGNGAGDRLSGNLVFTNITGNQWVCSGGGAYTNAVTFNWSCGGNVTLASALTQVRITTVNGTDTFGAGTVNILYEG